MGEPLEPPTQAVLNAARARLVAALRAQGFDVLARQASLADEVQRPYQEPLTTQPWLNVHIRIPRTFGHKGYILERLRAMVAASGSGCDFELVPPPDPLVIDDPHPLVRIFAWAKVFLRGGGEYEHDVVRFTFSTPQIAEVFELDPADTAAILAVLKANVNPGITEHRLGDTPPDPEIDVELAHLYFIPGNAAAYLEGIVDGYVPGLIADYTSYVIKLGNGHRQDM